jgi:hypothetical protein
LCCVQAELARELRLGLMIDARATVDKLESVVAADRWSLPTYEDLLFLDKTSADLCTPSLSAFSAAAARRNQ